MTDEQQPILDGRGLWAARFWDLASRLRERFSGLRQPSSIIRFEQAVYGSFSFRDQGYALLAQSPGCRPEWLAEFRTACQNLGERPSGVPEAAGLFALRLPSGPWVVVGVSPQGCDDRGRPGALAFHGLFLSAREYRRAGSDPFALAGALETRWTEQTRALPAGSATIEPSAESDRADPRALRIARAMAKGRRVALEAAGPIDLLARQVWRALPEQARARASVATWAFGNGNRFDLVALPRLSGVALDATYLDPEAEDATAPAPAGRHSPPLWIVVGMIALLIGVGVGLALRDGGGPTTRAAPDPVDSAVSVPGTPPPSPLRDGREDVGPDERRRVAEELAALADRFGVSSGDASSSDSSALMEQFARGLRYRGPFLSDADLQQIGREPGYDAALALRWDAHTRRFADDRPLPEDFRRGPLRWQLDVFAWSFHGETNASPAPGRRSAPEVVQALGESLAVDFSLRPTPLSARYPALSSYLGFLGRLPRR